MHNPFASALRGITFTDLRRRCEVCHNLTPHTYRDVQMHLHYSCPGFCTFASQLVDNLSVH